MRCDREGFILCGFGECGGRARYKTAVIKDPTPLCPAHRFMMDIEGVPTETLPFLRFTGHRQSPADATDIST